MICWTFLSRSPTIASSARGFSRGSLGMCWMLASVPAEISLLSSGHRGRGHQCEHSDADAGRTATPAAPPGSGSTADGYSSARVSLRVVRRGCRELRILRPARIPPSSGSGRASPCCSTRRAIGSMAGFTFLTPHVYLDTVPLLGTIGSAQPAALRPAFAAGAISTSFFWFCRAWVRSANPEARVYSACYLARA